MEIKHTDHFHTDDQIKTSCQQIVIVRILAQIGEISEREDQLKSH